MVETSSTPVALFCTYLWSQSECSRLSCTSTRESSVWKVWLTQLITESRYLGNSSTMSTICPASIEPSRTTKPMAATSTAMKTRKVARPLRIPRPAMRLTAGSMASARKKAMRMLVSSPMSW
ncbi:hypothetical protein RKD45_005133 [Streptomyces griseus]